MVDYLLAIVLVMVALGGWILIQALARKFAARHPEYGPAREEGGSCGKSCLCQNGQCINRQPAEKPTNHNQHSMPQRGNQHDHSQ